MLIKFSYSIKNLFREIFKGNMQFCDMNISVLRYENDSLCKVHFVGKDKTSIQQSDSTGPPKYREIPQVLDRYQRWSPTGRLLHASTLLTMDMILFFT